MRINLEHKCRADRGNGEGGESGQKDAQICAYEYLHVEYVCTLRILVFVR